ncbi:MAG: universal stress protein [Kofleriaceae bacterium]
MTFTKILCPTDFSEGSQQAVRVATRLAIEANADLVLFHSWFIPPQAYSMEAPFLPYVVQDVVDDAQRGLDSAVSDAIAAGAKTATGQLVTGVPWNEIVSILEKQAFDLCVIGTHGRTGLSRLLLGSVAEKVIRHSPCAVLAVRPDSNVGAFKHVLVPTDFSESATHALDLARKVVAPDGAITLLHVLELPLKYSGEIGADFAHDLDKKAAAALEVCAERVKNVRITTRSRIGYAGAQTLSAIDHDHSIDLVVMGSHGRTGIKRALLGSVAEKVVRHAHCPVLVTRQRP